jgi:uncharacterized protein (DUF2252 family)
MRGVVPAREDSAADGKRLRDAVPLEDHRLFTPASGRDPIALLRAQDRTRLPDLLPVRYARMARSPFAYYRGSAVVMACDLARASRTGMQVQACGDAHLANFGVFATPERALVFDVNDFDETVPGPWEWDVKRLAVSVRLASRNNGFREDAAEDAVRRCLERYRTHIGQYADQSVLAVWYAQLDREAVATVVSQKRMEKTLSPTKLKDSLRAVRKLTVSDGGSTRLAERPPVLTHVDPPTERELRKDIDSYLASLPTERRTLVQRFTTVDFARKVVGVGSVGTRCYVVLLFGRTMDDPLFLQLKEAQSSVLEAYGFPSEFENHGARVVHGQRAIQAASDVFLGWCRVGGRDFYVRQLADKKGGADLESMSPEGLAQYSELCGWALARAHARTGNPARLAGYLGRSPRFDDAVRRFSRAYADQVERDHARLTAAIRSGRIIAEAEAV